MTTPRILIHCGLHKTGTTALQHLLQELADALPQYGVLYPRVGRNDGYGGGHHNIAWQLMRDRRYDPAVGGIERLAEEIGDFDGDVLLSSEDFESCLDRLWLFDPLLRHPRLRRFRVVLVVYLRDQISYAKSLYAQLMTHGVGDECLPVMTSILRDHCLDTREWRYQFDYDRLRQCAGAQRGMEVVFRSYASLQGGAIASDFLPFLLPGRNLALDGGASLRMNIRRRLVETLLRFYANRVGRRVAREEAAACWLLHHAVGGAPMVLPHALRAAFVEAFDAGNARCCAATGLPVADLRLADRVPPPPPQACFLDRVFSFETQQVIAALAHVVPRALVDNPETAPPPDDLSASARGLLGHTLAGWRQQRMQMA